MKTTSIRALILAFFLMLSFIRASEAGQEYSVSPILTPDGWTDVRVHGLNNLGQVSGFGINGSNFQPFIATTSGSAPIPLPPDWPWANAYGINDYGQVAGYGGNWIHAFIGTKDGITILPEPEGWAFPFAWDINNFGQIVGGVGTGNSHVAFIGTISGMIAVPLPPGCIWAEGMDINDNGQVVGSVYYGSNYQAFIGTTNSCTLIPIPSGWWLTYGTGINIQGMVAGCGIAGTPSPHYESFVATASGITILPLPSGWQRMHTVTYSPINAAGQVVGSGGPPGASLGWIWDQTNGTRVLNELVPSDWTIQEAKTINNKGQILAIGSNQNGYSGPVLLDPISITVRIDIKPGSDPNSISLGSNGNIPVAIFSTSDFDATIIDPTTVTLAGATVGLKGKGTPMVSFEDIDGDGRLDLIVHVDTTALQLTFGDTEAIFEGKTYDGTKIRGKDSVRIVR